MTTQVSKTLNSDLYPDLQQSGGLAPALQRVFEELRTDLIVRQLGEPQLLVYVYVRRGERSCQVMIAELEYAFHVDFWNQGVVYGGGWVSDLTEIGRAIVAFQVQKDPVQEMASHFAWFTGENGRAHEGGPVHFVDEAWRRLADRIEYMNKDLLPLVIEAGCRAELRQHLSHL